MDIQRTIDDIDLRILEILQEKARIPNAEVARQVGMAPSAVLERIRKLEGQGIIQGYEVRLDPRHFGQNLTAFVSLKVDCAAADLDCQLAALTGVQEVHQVAGDDGYLLKLRVADTAELGHILRHELAALQGVVQTRTNIVVKSVKETRKISLKREQQRY
ncbi:MAG: Lrp/AsnC family transcriptional regulator [Desulfuromonas sp.]|nr:MAG: Lrp/AsnC family transcriptional regulator [Desulfuromonas sp.]